MSQRPLADLGAGLTTKSNPLDPHPAGPVQHGTPGQVERAFTAASTFFSGILAISASQFLGAPLKAIDPKFYEAYIAFTKQSFGVLIATMTQWWSPTVVRISGDTSLPNQLYQKPDGSLESRFPQRLVLMANHQLYTDWLYLWWVAYTNQMHGHIYIILKDSLRNVPIIGWGAQFYNFIFLTRKWEEDKKQFQGHLDRLNKSTDPMWLLIFPEGTNLAKGTREKSKAWADKSGVQDMKHQLLPRSRGLQFALQRLRGSTEWLYDCTIGYEGIPPGKFGQDIFTLRSSMFEGRPPKSVNMHFRRFRVSKIPINDDKAFEIWLRNRWREKDYLLEHFVRFNRFPDNDKWMMAQRKLGKTKFEPQPARYIQTQIKSNSLEEFLSIFAPVTAVLMVLFLASGEANPQELMKVLSGKGGQGIEKLSKALENAPQESVRLQKLLADAMSPSLSTAGPSSGKALARQYMASIRPAAAKQIDLPSRALCQPVAKKAASVSGETRGSKEGSLTKTKKTAVRASRAPSVVSAPASVGRATGLKKTASAPKEGSVRKDQQVTVDASVLERLRRGAEGSTGPRAVMVDPEVLKKMKAGT